MRILILSLLVAVSLLAFRVVPAFTADDHSPSTAVSDMAQAAKSFSPL